MGGINALKSLVLLAVCSTLLACPSEEDEFRSVVSVKLAPLKDTFEVGDTLWVESTFPETFEELNGPRSIRYSASIWCRFPLSEVSESAPDGIFFNTGKSNYDVVVERGVLLQDKAIKIDAHYIDNAYEFRFGIIFRKAGLYILTDDLGWGEENEITFFQRFEINDTNADLIPDSFPVVKKMMADYQDESKALVLNRVYCFYVK